MAYMREVQPGDIEYIAPRLREADRQEIQAACGLPPLEALDLSVLGSNIACTIVGPQNRPAAIFGLVYKDELSAVIWMLGTEALVEPPLRREFLKKSREVLASLHTIRPLLFNAIDARNTVHIRWLQWLGFSFIRRVYNYGSECREFLEFARLSHPKE